MIQTSVKMKLLCTQVAKDLLGQGIDVSMVHNEYTNWKCSLFWECCVVILEGVLLPLGSLT